MNYGWIHANSSERLMLEGFGTKVVGYDDKRGAFVVAADDVAIGRMKEFARDFVPELYAWNGGSRPAAKAPRAAQLAWSAYAAYLQHGGEPGRAPVPPGCAVMTGYRRARMELRALARATQVGRKDKIAVLNRFHDLRRLSASGEVGAHLTAAAAEIEEESTRRHAKREQLMTTLYECRVQALRAIGEHFGGLAFADAGGSVGQRFKRWWVRANSYRETQLDGVNLYGAYDENGPMFGAFARSFGYDRPIDLVRDVRLEREMRTGERPLDLDACIRLGITLRAAGVPDSALTL